MNEIVERLTKEHEDILQGLSIIEEALCGPTTRGDVWGVLQTVLGLVDEKIEPHYLEEERIIFPELDKFPRKEPLVLAHLEHDDLETLLHLVNKHIASAVMYKDELLKRSAVQNVCLAINFIKRHFELEEELIFPMISDLTKEQQEKILLALKNFDGAELK